MVCPTATRPSQPSHWRLVSSNPTAVRDAPAHAFGPAAPRRPRAPLSLPHPRQDLPVFRHTGSKTLDPRP
eukprot:27550-Rhodomonas_salina.1